MKQLIVSENPTTIFFEENVTVQNICSWINKNMDYFDIDIEDQEDYSAYVHPKYKHIIHLVGEEISIFIEVKDVITKKI